MEGYFTDREYEERPPSIDVVDERLWQDSAACNGPCGCDEQAFHQILAVEVRWIEWPLSPTKVPETPVILDPLEFCAKAVGEPIQGAYHSFFRHHDLSWDREAGLQLFVADVNTLLQRNALSEVSGIGCWAIGTLYKENSTRLLF